MKSHAYFGQTKYDLFDINKEKVQKGMLSDKRIRKRLITKANQTGPKVKSSGIEYAKYGLFAERNYKKGEYITLYGGARLEEPRGGIPTSFSVPASMHPSERGVIDGEYGFNMKTEKGRWVNNPVDPRWENVSFVYFNDQIIVAAKRDIKRYSEFFFNYDENFLQPDNSNYEERNEIGACMQCGTNKVKHKCSLCDTMICSEECLECHDC